MLSFQIFPRVMYKMRENLAKNFGFRELRSYRTCMYVTQQYSVPPLKADPYLVMITVHNTYQCNTSNIQHFSFRAFFYCKLFLVVYILISYEKVYEMCEMYSSIYKQCCTRFSWLFDCFFFFLLYYPYLVIE